MAYYMHLKLAPHRAPCDAEQYDQIDPQAAPMHVLSNALELQDS